MFKPDIYGYRNELQHMILLFQDRLRQERRGYPYEARVYSDDEQAYEDFGYREQLQHEAV